jgi:hypothetical protein
LIIGTTVAAGNFAGRFNPLVMSTRALNLYLDMGLYSQEQKNNVQRASVLMELQVNLIRYTLWLLAIMQASATK